MYSRTPTSLSEEATLRGGTIQGEAQDETTVFELADELVSKVIELRHQLDRKLEETTGITEFLDACKGFQEKVMKKIDRYREDFEKLPLVYEDNESKKSFDIMIEAAGPRTADFMRCFYFTIHAQESKVLAHRRFQYEGTRTKIGRGPLRRILDPPENRGKRDREEAREFLDQLASAKPSQPWLPLPTGTRRLIEYEFRWIFLDSLVHAFGPYGKQREFYACSEEESSDESDDNDEDDSSNEIHLSRLRNILSSFLRADTNQYVFETIPAQVLMMRTDKATWKMFLLKFLLSFFCLSCLVVLTAKWNLDQASLHCLQSGAKTYDSCWQIHLCFSVLMICNIIEIGIIGEDIYLWRWKWFSFWNIVEFVLEASCLVCVLSFMHLDIRGNAPMWLLPAISAARWLDFTLLVLYWPAIGIKAMPAVLAAFSDESFVIFLCIMMATLAATHTYFGFRVLENGETFGFYGTWGIFQGFMRMSRALMFAEGDVDHLAGRKEVIVVEGENTVIDEEDSGHWGKVGSFNKFIECINLFTWLILVLGVLLMNTYVGVLTDKYAEINSHKLHYYQSWRAQWQLKALTRRTVLAKFCVREVARMSLVTSWKYDDSRPDDDHFGKGLWIVSPPEETESRHTTKLRGYVKEVKGELTMVLGSSIKEVKDDLAKVKDDIAEIKRLLQTPYRPSSVSVRR